MVSAGLVLAEITHMDEGCCNDYAGSKIFSNKKSQFGYTYAFRPGEVDRK